MTKESFESMIQKHPRLSFHLVEGGRYIVKNDKDQKFEVFEKDITGEWWQWEKVLLGERKADIMEHFTRVCGYYSDLRNWNMSKISELHDRQKGDYEVH